MIKVDPAKRFWSKVAKSENCWNWIAFRHRGYGQFWNGKRTIHAHRFSYQLNVGPIIPETLTIDHLCQNRSCVNPDHLQAIPNVDNARLGSNAQNTLCPKGHPFEGNNILWVKDAKGRLSRMCRFCKESRDRWRKR